MQVIIWETFSLAPFFALHYACITETGPQRAGCHLRLQRQDSPSSLRVPDSLRGCSLGMSTHTVASDVSLKLTETMFPLNKRKGTVKGGQRVRGAGWGTQRGCHPQCSRPWRHQLKKETVKVSAVWTEHCQGRNRDSSWSQAQVWSLTSS